MLLSAQKELLGLDNHVYNDVMAGWARFGSVDKFKRFGQRWKRMGWFQMRFHTDIYSRDWVEQGGLRMHSECLRIWYMRDMVQLQWSPMHLFSILFLLGIWTGASSISITRICWKKS
jgi:hypothetical protein